MPKDLIEQPKCFIRLRGSWKKQPMKKILGNSGKIKMKKVLAISDFINGWKIKVK